MEWKKATIELGVEVAVESGTLVAVIGKANGKSTLKVQLEFDRATD